MTSSKLEDMFQAHCQQVEAMASQLLERLLEQMRQDLVYLFQVYQASSWIRYYSTSTSNVVKRSSQTHVAAALRTMQPPQPTRSLHVGPVYWRRYNSKTYKAWWLWVTLPMLPSWEVKRESRGFGLDRQGVHRELRIRSYQRSTPPPVFVQRATPTSRR